MDDATRELLERIQLHAMPEGSAQCKGTWLRQVGEMRLAPARPWLPFEAEQWFTGDGIDFRWEARVRMAPFLRVSVTDSFERGRGLLAVRLLGIVPLVWSRGPTTDRGEAMRGIAELPWRPYAFRDSRWLTWKIGAANRLEAVYNDASNPATVEFDVDAEGRLVRCSAPNRPRMVGKTAVNTPWTGVLSDYRELDHLRVPTRAEVAWVLPEGAFAYWRAKVVDFRALR